MSNPYISIINSLRPNETNENKYPFGLGTVISINPLKIRFGDLILYKDDLMINEEMIRGYEREISITNTNVDSQTNKIHDGGKEASAHDHRLDNWSISNGLIRMNNNILEKGDTVFIISINEGQLFIVLVKLVSV